MYKIFLSAALLLVVVTSVVAADSSLKPEQFPDASIREHIRTLASDAFGGRGPATTGEKLTTDYLVREFRRSGLQPANHGSFLQEVSLVRITASPDTTLAVSGGGAPLRLVYGDDMIVFTPRPQAQVVIRDTPLVFAGYGIVAPEYQWNDYAGLDVKGKIVVVLVNDPGHVDPALFRGRTMTYYGRWTYKYEEAARHGAAGVLIVHDTGPSSYPWEVVRNSFSGPRELLPPDGSYQLAVQGWISHDAAIRLFAAAGQDLAKLSAAAAKPGFHPAPLDLTAGITLRSQVDSVLSHNVVALVKGARYPDQVMIYSAHWDHFGTRPGPDGKPMVFHGAVDNGSGTAALLALAQAFAAHKPAPARSVLFLAVTAEEQGLLGSAYYAAHPLFQLRETVADLNMDMMNMGGRTRDLSVFGQFMSQLDEDLKHVAGSQGLTLPEPEPDVAGLYFRSDHFSFAKAGVPALSIGTGSDFVGRPAGWGRQQGEDYEAHRYHKPQDVYEPGWDLYGMRQQLAVLYALGLDLADGADWPQWHADSPFRAVREAQRRPQ